MPHPASSSGLRSRKIDHKRPLAVYRASDLNDLDEASNLSRTLHSISTGVEKEEEEEHHLQAALHANSVGVLNSAVVIPTPDASRMFPDFARYYTKTFIVPKSLIRFSAQIDECMGCLYNMDETDDKWLAENNNKCKSGEHLASHVLNEDQFEELMWAMETVADEKLTKECPTLEEIYNYIDIEIPELCCKKDVAKVLFEYWKERRFNERGGNHIIPRLKTEEIGPKPDSDPYICFRKREIKALRKRGRMDGQSIEKLTRLRLELHRAKQLLELVAKRESLRKEALTIEQEIFEQRVRVRRLKKKLGISEQEASPDKAKKKLKREPGYPLAKIKIPMQKFRDAAQIMSEADLRTHLEGGQITPFLEALQMDEKAKKKYAIDKNQGWIDTTEDAYHPYPSPTYENDIWSAEFSQNHLSGRHHQMPSFCGRKRIGRNGRVWVDQHYRKRDIEKLYGDDSKDFNRFTSGWGFNLSDDEIEYNAAPLESDDISIHWRAFHLCATTDQECRSLINRPSFPEQINPAPTPLGQKKPEITPPQVIRSQQLGVTPTSTNNTTTTKKKAAKLVNNDKNASKDSNSNSPASGAAANANAANNNKKKTTEPVMDARTATIKAMMQQAQRKAQANASQSQSQSHQKSVSISNADSAPGTPKQSAQPLPPTTTIQNAPSAGLSAPSSPKSTNEAKISSPKQQNQQTSLIDLTKATTPSSALPQPNSVQTATTTVSATGAANINAATASYTANTPKIPSQISATGPSTPLPMNSSASTPSLPASSSTPVTTALASTAANHPATPIILNTPTPSSTPNLPHPQLPQTPQQMQQAIQQAQAVAQQQQQQAQALAAVQNARLQQMRMQPPHGPGMIPGVPMPPSLANLNAQQLQQLYFQSQQQMMNAMATGAMHQAQAAALQNRMRFGLGAGNAAVQNMAMMAGPGGQMPNAAQFLQAQLQQLQQQQQQQQQHQGGVAGGAIPNMQTQLGNLANAPSLLSLQQQLISKKVQGAAAVGMPNALAAAMAMSNTTDTTQLMNSLNGFGAAASMANASTAAMAAAAMNSMSAQNLTGTPVALNNISTSAGTAAATASSSGSSNTVATTPASNKTDSSNNKSAKDAK